MPCTVQQGTHVRLVSPGNIDDQHTCVMGSKMSVFAATGGKTLIIHQDSAGCD